MRLPTLFRTTPFRLTLLFLGLFISVSSAMLAYVYFATWSDARHRAEVGIEREVSSLKRIYDRDGVDALNAVLVEYTLRGGSVIYLLAHPDGKPITGNISASPVTSFTAPRSWTDFHVTSTDELSRVQTSSARGLEVQLSGGEHLFVGVDMGGVDSFLARIVQALWGAFGLVMVLGLFGGVLVSRGVERVMGSLNSVIGAVQGGDLARALVRGTRDEMDELAQGLNGMLDRLEASMASIRHAGDAIAHDLRSPLTRMRAKIEVALIEVENGRGDALSALETALTESDELLKTFNAVLAISRLQAAGQAPDPQLFDASEVARDLADLYEPASEDRGLEFSHDIEPGLLITGNRAFVAQALANLIDNALKYTPTGGAVRLCARRKGSGEVELSVTDTGPGVPEADRERVVQRFVRLENSRNAQGSGLGLSLVVAVVEAHGGMLDLSDGPGRVGEMGPGLRSALVFPSGPVVS